MDAAAMASGVLNRRRRDKAADRPVNEQFLMPDIAILPPIARAARIEHECPISTGSRFTVQTPVHRLFGGVRTNKQGMAAKKVLSWTKRQCRFSHGRHATAEDRGEAMSDAVSPQVLSDLIGSIYDCALDPSRWDQTLAEVTEAFYSHAAVLSLSDLKNDCLLIYKTVGIELYWQEQQAKHVAETHAIVSQALAASPSPDEPLVLSRHVTPAAAEASPYIQECLRPQGVSDVMQLVIMRTPARFAGLAVSRNERQGIFTERDMAFARLFLPHLRRAVTISDVLEVRTIERERMAEALGALRCGVVLTDARGAILHANQAAEAMLLNGSTIQGTGGMLQAKSGSAATELRAAIRLAAQDEASIGKTGLAICLTEPDLPPVFAHVLPMTGGSLRTRLQARAVAAVFISAPPDAQDSADMMAAAYSLTPAETRVLASLLGGRTMSATAAALGIAATTANTHLDNIFGKTGVSRQADLMRLGTGLVPPTTSNM